MSNEDTFDETRQRAIDLLEDDNIETFAVVGGSVQNDQFSYDAFWNSRRSDPEQEEAAFLNNIAILVIMYSQRKLSPSEDSDRVLTIDNILLEVGNRIKHIPDMWTNR